MSNTKTQLEVGDVVYGFRYGTMQSRHEITSVTKTQAKAGDIRMRRSLDTRGFTMQIAGYLGENMGIYLETPRYKAEWDKMQAWDKIQAALIR